MIRRSLKNRFLMIALVVLLAGVSAAWGAGHGGGGFGGGDYGGHGGFGGGYGGYGHGWGGSAYGWRGGYWTGYGGYGYSPSYGAGWYGFGSGYTPGYYGTYAPGYFGSGYYYATTPTSASGSTTADAAAYIELSVPADAEVWFNDTRMEQTGTSRTFRSPPLAAGRDYAYQIKAKWLEDGKPVEKTQRVLVQADRQLSVNLVTGTVEVAPATTVARINVTVPTAEAKVWLNGTATQSTGLDRRFVSPPLQRGQNYSYEVRAQWLEDGRTVERTTKVAVHAGKQIDLDLTRATVAAGK
jgi:uncharacterized protein (TIGR03000 family)